MVSTILLLVIMNILFRISYVNRKYLAERYDLSISTAELLEAFKSHLGKDFERKEIHKILSKVYFETRKAVEYRLSKELSTENK